MSQKSIIEFPRTDPEGRYIFQSYLNYDIDRNLAKKSGPRRRRGDSLMIDPAVALKELQEENERLQILSCAKGDEITRLMNRCKDLERKLVVEKRRNEEVEKYLKTVLKMEKDRNREIDRIRVRMGWNDGDDFSPTNIGGIGGMSSFIPASAVSDAMIYGNPNPNPNRNRNRKRAFSELNLNENENSDNRRGRGKESAVVHQRKKVKATCPPTFRNSRVTVKFGSRNKSIRRNLHKFSEDIQIGDVLYKHHGFGTDLRLFSVCSEFMKCMEGSAKMMILENFEVFYEGKALPLELNPTDEDAFRFYLLQTVRWGLDLEPVSHPIDNVGSYYNYFVSVENVEFVTLDVAKDNWDELLFGDDVEYQGNKHFVGGTEYQHQNLFMDLSAMDVVGAINIELDDDTKTTSKKGVMRSALLNKAFIELRKVIPFLGDLDRVDLQLFVKQSSLKFIEQHYNHTFKRGKSGKYYNALCKMTLYCSFKGGEEKEHLKFPFVLSLRLQTGQ